MSKKNNNNNKKPQNQVKQVVNEVKAKETKAETENIEGKKYPVKEKLGFATGKRNFYVKNKNILIIEGGFISQEDYDLLSADARKAFLA